VVKRDEDILRVTLEGEIKDLYKVCYEELGIRISYSNRANWEDDIVFIGSWAM
jgi:hypothetical protein